MDIGVNLTNSSFKNRLEQVVEEAVAAKVSVMVVTGTSADSSEKAWQLATKFPEHLYSTAGIHPHDAKTANESSLSQIKALLQEEKVLAVGETGLDFNRDFSPRPTQEKVFQQHLELAVETGKPLFLHQRDAHERFLPMLKECRDHISNAVVHCFTDNQTALFDYLDLDLHIGITGWVCDERRGQELQEMVTNIPLNRLMIETDAPYLFPRDLKIKPRPKCNEPKFLPHIADTLARLYNIPADVFRDEVWQTSKTFFNL